MPDIREFLSHLKSAYEARIAAAIAVPAREAAYADLEPPLNDDIRKRLARIGIENLYRYQAEAITKIRGGEDVIVIAGTAGGKTATFLVPLLERLASDPESTAILVYPTKALAQDQLATLGALAPEIFSACYDGDTPQAHRPIIRKNAHVILTNIDMLHYSLLPDHRSWAHFLRNLALVVLDEAHTYRGTFGSNAALVLRRLERLVRLYRGTGDARAQPYRYVLASATLGNPGELAHKLTGRQVAVVTDDSSPCAPRTFLFWNPPFLPDKQRRASSNLEATAILVDAIRHGIRAIAFSKSKLVAELVARYTRERLMDIEGVPADAIAAYRAGYLASERRDIERRLFEGSLRAVSSTSALELGIDVGSLDMTIINGFPGTTSSFFQQAGRSGRKGESIAVYIAGEDPLDQHYAAHPEDLFERPREAAIIDTENRYLLASHILCSCYEYPLAVSDVEVVFGSAARPVVLRLCEQGDLVQKKGKLFVSPRLGRPHERVSVRTASSFRVQIVDVESGALKGELDEALAYLYVHPGAIYLHQAETYRVVDLKLDEGIALVTREHVPYYTQPREDSRVTVESVLKARQAGPVELYFGDLTVETRVLGFRKRHVITQEALGYEELFLPPHIFATKGIWFVVPDEITERLSLAPDQLAGGIHAIEHATIGLMPLFVSCDRWDIGGVSTPAHYETDATTIFIYDGVEGGLGYSEKAYDMFEALIRSARDLVERCPCSNGCPGCIQSPKCGNANEPLDKEAALRILREIA